MLKLAVASVALVVAGVLVARRADRQAHRLGVTARRGLRTGAIEVDPRAVEAAVTAAVRQFDPCPPPPGYKTPHATPHYARLAPIDVHDAATGERRRIPVVVSPRAMDTGQLVTGEARTAVEKASARLMDQWIVLMPRPTCRSVFEWRHALTTTLTHELAHTSDPKVIINAKRRARAAAAHAPVARRGTSAGETAADYSAYLNDPAEIAANLTAVRAELDQARLDLDDSPDWLLRQHSDRWNDLAPFLTPANTRRFYRMAARARDEREARQRQLDAEMTARWAAEDAEDETP